MYNSHCSDFREAEITVMMMMNSLSSRRECIEIKQEFRSLIHFRPRKPELVCLFFISIIQRVTVSKRFETIEYTL